MARPIQGHTNGSADNSGKDGKNAPKIGLFVSTALASLVLASCAAGKGERAVNHAEAAVLADPRNASYRSVLGAAYLEQGRFVSAATAFGEAMELGDNDPRTVLSFALAKVATGDNGAALAQLTANQNSIPVADLGLAMALAGQPERGVHHLINAVRNGQNSAKARQNLAYAYALAGNWPAARVMAAEDVPADQLDARLSDWAAAARPEDYQLRVASLLGVSPSNDGGQPVHLALANFPEQPFMVAGVQSDAPAPVSASPAAPSLAVAEVSGSDGVTGGVETVDPSPRAAPVRVADRSSAPRDVAPRAVTPRTTNPRVVGPRPVSPSNASAPRSAPQPVAAPVTPPVSMPAVAAAPSRGAPRYVSNAVVQRVPAASAESRTPQRVARPAARPAAQPTPRPAPQRRVAAATGSADTHLVQLGSFSTRAVAEAKWEEMQRRMPQLAGHDVVITEARVNGRTFFRVAAAGFGRRSAANMCNSVKARGAGCFSYAAASPPAGAVNRGVRIAARTR